MRRCNIVTGILLVLSIIDFALAAPVPGQEKYQARVDVVHMPKDLTTVLGKRWEEELENLGEEYFKTSGKSIDSLGTHSSSSTAPSGTDHGSTNVVQPPALNIASPAATPDPLMESSCSSSCSSSTSSMESLRLSPRGNCFTCLRLLDKFADRVLDWSQDRMYPSTSSDHSPGPGTDYHSSDSDYESELTAPHRQPNLNLRPPMNPPENQNFDFDRLTIGEDPPPLDSPPLKPVSPKEDSEGSQSPGQGSPVTPPEQEEALRPLSSPILLRPESHGAASQPVDPLAAITTMKGKVKESK